MKNVLVIDGALNCAYDIYTISDADFEIIFPDDQDIEFAEDLEDGRLSEQELEDLGKRLWKNRIEKKLVNGIHGTLFYGLGIKKKFYPNKKDSDLTANGGRPS